MSAAFLAAPSQTSIRSDSSFADAPNADRTSAEEIASLVSVLVQSDKFGTSVSQALRTFANSMREIRSQRAEESAEKMPIKLLFPMAFCIFPAVLVVLVGPAGIQWAEIISSG